MSVAIFEEVLEKVNLLSLEEQLKLRDRMNGRKNVGSTLNLFVVCVGNTHIYRQAAKILPDESKKKLNLKIKVGDRKNDLKSKVQSPKSALIS